MRSSFPTIKFTATWKRAKEIRVVSNVKIDIAVALWEISSKVIRS
tara:strand:- start:363 stop:497 length:135 start_codon:yes stop_codon:yes gene_type:complete